MHPKRYRARATNLSPPPIALTILSASLIETRIGKTKQINKRRKEENKIMI
jgi:hypothetical protein